MSHQANGKIYRVKANCISLNQQNWNKGSLISGDRLGPLVKYFYNLGLIEEVVLKRVDVCEAVQTVHARAA